LDNRKNYSKKNKAKASSKASETRRLVLDILMESESESVRFDLVLKNSLEKYDYADRQDKAFVSRLSRGCMQRRITLDYIIDQYADTGKKVMKPVIRNILRMGVYQILFMDGVKDFAACNESVALANEKGFKGLSGFVNGVLRTIVREKDSISMPDRTKKLSEYRSVYYSLPYWMVRLLEKQFDDDTMDVMLEAFNDSKGFSLRVNAASEDNIKTVTDELEKAGAEYEISDYLPFMINVRGIEGVASLDCFNNGLVTVQDISSALVSEIAGIKSGDHVLDMCAAPGGKATHAAIKAGQMGSVTACDISEEKLSLIYDNKERHNINNMEILLKDATVFEPEFEEKFDVVICDAPCSGLGIMGRKPDIRYNVTFDNIKELAALQKNILENAVKYVKKGGVLIFSTCTLTVQENMEGRDFILEKGMKAEGFYDILSDGLKRDCDKASAEAGFMVLVPGKTKCDGFFISKYIKQ